MKVLTWRRPPEQAGSHGHWLPGQPWVSAPVGFCPHMGFCPQVGFCHKGPRVNARSVLPILPMLPAPHRATKTLGGLMLVLTKSGCVSIQGHAQVAAHNPAGWSYAMPQLHFGPGAQTG